MAKWWNDTMDKSQCGIWVSVRVDPYNNNCYWELTIVESVIFRLTWALFRLTITPFLHFVISYFKKCPIHVDEKIIETYVIIRSYYFLAEENCDLSWLSIKLRYAQREYTKIGNSWPIKKIMINFIKQARNHCCFTSLTCSIQWDYASLRHCSSLFPSFL